MKDDLKIQGTNKEARATKTATTYRTTQSAAGKLASTGTQHDGQVR